MNLTFDEIVEEYLIYKKMKQKIDTYETLERRIKKHLNPFFTSKIMSEISIKDYFNWQLYIEEQGFKYNYKSSLHYTFSDIYEYCNKFYNIENIAKKVGNFKNNEEEKIGNVWTLNDFNQFFNSIKNIKDQIMFELLFFTGIRKGELLALTWNDIDFVNKTISINKTITRNHIIQPPKTKSSNRVIGLPDKLLNKLKTIQNDEKFIFDISFTTLKRKKDNYCDIAGVKKIKIHEFRHSHAVLLYKNDIPIDEISNRLGHSKISITTDIYLKYLPKQEKRVLNYLNTLNLN